MNPFRGMWTAIVTPFRGGQLDRPALEQHVERQIAAGVDGLVPCGTTGESPTLSVEEHVEVVATTVRVARQRVPVCAGAGTNCTAKTVELSRRCADAGADGLLLVAPYYNRPSQVGLFQHFAAVARAVRLPIMLYNIPGRCGVEIAIDTIARLHREFPSITAVKHATGSVSGAADLADVSDIAILSGDDPITLPLMSQGAVGVVSVMSNLIPKTVKRLTQAALESRWIDAQLAHREAYGFSKRLLGLDINPIPIKSAAAIKGWCAEEFRLPMCPLAPEARAKLVALLEERDLG
ncbi:4-hydroxy-tetrahydrodipicolinate synthase [Phycisphaerae bacterium RAS1]|nr:4-hydroxy-tetrahydrodipicolinate synthase [Phycisphaerae bacterium RAS1]